MSLNNIFLPPKLIAQLYQNTLVEGSARAVPQKKRVSYLGKNEKNILIIVNHKSMPFLPDEELAFLTLVLSKCELSLSDVAIVNWDKAEEKDVTVLHQLSPKEVLFFDVPPGVIGFLSNPIPYAVQKTGIVQYVYAQSLSQIEKTIQTKSQLWVALKELFCL